MRWWRGMWPRPDALFDSALGVMHDGDASAHRGNDDGVFCRDRVFVRVVGVE